MPCRQPLLQQQPLQAQQQQQMVLAQPQDSYLASRNEALHQVETTIHELGSIFQQLAHMVRHPVFTSVCTLCSAHSPAQRMQAVHSHSSVGSQFSMQHGTVLDASQAVQLQSAKRLEMSTWNWLHAGARAGRGGH